MAVNLVEYSAVGGAISIVCSGRTSEAEPAIGHAASGIAIWRTQFGKLVAVDLFGWQTRSVEAWRALFPHDLPLDGPLLAQIEVAVHDGTAWFLASQPPPEPDAASSGSPRGVAPPTRPATAAASDHVGRSRACGVDIPTNS